MAEMVAFNGLYSAAYGIWGTNLCFLYFSFLIRNVLIFVLMVCEKLAKFLLAIKKI